MSKEELERVAVLGRVKNGQLRVVDAVRLLGVSYRQAKRLWKRYREEAPAGLKHRSAGWAKYGCPLHHSRGMCANALVVRRDQIERELISGLQREVLQEDVAAFALEEFKRQLHARLDDTKSHLDAMRNKRAKLKAEIANLARAIAEGHSSATLLDELGKREREPDNISKELLAADGRGLDARFGEIEVFVQKHLQDIRALLFADVPRAKAELSKHCTAITLTPEGSTFRISGDWNLLGGRSGGAGGPHSTTRVRLQPTLGGLTEWPTRKTLALTGSRL